MSTERRWLNPTGVTIGGIAAKDNINIGVDSNSQPLGSSSENDTMANHFLQSMQRGETATVRIFDLTAAVQYMGFIGQKKSVSFYLPPAAAGSNPCGVTWTSTITNDAGAIVQEVNISAGGKDDFWAADVTLAFKSPDGVTNGLIATIPGAGAASTSTDNRWLNVTSVSFTNFDALSVTLEDAIAAGIAGTSQLLTSNSENDTHANHFVQGVEIAQAINLSTFDIAGAKALEAKKGVKGNLSFTIPHAANSTTNTDYNVHSSTTCSAGVVIQDITFSAGRNELAQAQISMLVKCKDTGRALGLVFTPVANP